MKEDIRNYNEKGQEHGYIEIYLYGNTLYYRTNYKHGLEIGYEEIHPIKQTLFHIR